MNEQPPTRDTGSSLLDDVTAAVHKTATRRRAIRVGIATAAGVTAASYVKPSFEALGVPAALAGVSTVCMPNSSASSSPTSSPGSGPQSSAVCQVISPSSSPQPVGDDNKVNDQLQWWTSRANNKLKPDGGD